MQWINCFFLICCFVFTGAGQTSMAAEKIGVDLVRLQTEDGAKLAGVLRQPRVSKTSACVVLVHGYSGNFYSGVMEFLPKALADKGFATLAINMRDHDRGPKHNRFEENRYDIKSAVDKMSLLGYHLIFLYGHSMGTNRVLYYMAATQDSRIKGIILTGPPGNLFEWNINVFGSEEAKNVLRQAQDLVAKGKGDQWMLINLGPLGKALYTANHVVSLRGPKTLSDPYKNIARISQPILIVSGLADRLADPDIADRLKSSATSNTTVTVVKIPGADHRFRHHQEKLVNIVARWITKHQSR